MENDRQTFSIRRSIRLRGYDYTLAGAYFVTLCSHNKACIFGEIVGGAMRLNTLGSMVNQQWRRTTLVRPSVNLDAFVIMPNHLHGILIIHDDISRGGECALGDTNENLTTGLKSGSLGAIIGQFKSAVTRQARRLHGTYDLQVWQRNYYEHVIRNEESLNEIRKYVSDNPARWAEDSLYVR